MGWGERSNGKIANPPVGVPLVGQPLTVLKVGVPMNMEFCCNCQSDNEPLTIVGSVAVQCPKCQKVYNALFNPTTKNIDMQIGIPKQETPA